MTCEHAANVLPVPPLGNAPFLLNHGLCQSPSHPWCIEKRPEQGA
jgi:hypothetical protein